MKLSKIYLGKPIPAKYHILFWVSYFTFNVIRWGKHFNNNYWYSFRSNLIEFPLHIALVYLNFFYLIPKFLFTKKYKKYFAYVFLSLIVVYSIRTILNYFYIWPEDSSGQDRGFTIRHIVEVTLGELYVLAFATLIRVTVDWIRERNKIEELQKEHLKTKLKFLKAQIQPHFFFNTLNNLYSLTLSKSDMAPSVVLKLSDIMQYVLYEIEEPKVKLLKEIEYIQSYIDLEKLRCHKDAKISVDIKGKIDHIEVPPLLLLPFIENGFKHGSKDSEDFFLTIKFENKDDQFLLFSIENKYDKKNIIHIKGGIGDKNVKKRLYLLFENNFNLTVIKTDLSYKVLLKIPV